MKISFLVLVLLPVIKDVYSLDVCKQKIVKNWKKSPHKLSGVKQFEYTFYQFIAASDKDVSNVNSAMVKFEGLKKHELHAVVSVLTNNITWVEAKVRLSQKKDKSFRVVGYVGDPKGIYFLYGWKINHFIAFYLCKDGRKTGGQKSDLFVVSAQRSKKDLSIGKEKVFESINKMNGAPVSMKSLKVSRKGKYELD